MRAERGFANAKDPATNDLSRGWCRLMGLAPLMLFTTTLLTARNQRILHAWNTRQEENQRRAAAGIPPEPANGAARPSPSSPPGHPDRAAARPRAPRPATTSQDNRHNQAKACPDTGQTTEPGPIAAPENPAPHHRPPESPNVRPKRENGPH